MARETPDEERERGCAGKHRFRSFRLANRVARAQSRRHKTKFQAYSCRHCGGFHTGTPLGGKRNGRPKV